MNDVNSKKGLVFLTCVFSTIAVVLCITSLGTEQWVVAKGELTIRGFENEQLSTIKYGLFSGTFFLFHTRTYYQIKMTCIVTENVCAYLCKSSADARELELRNLYNGQDVPFDMTCPQVSKLNPVQTPLEGAKTQKLRNDERVFLNASLYITTVLFLTLSIMFGICSALLSFWNTIANPTDSCLNINALYVYHALASAGLLAAIILWSIHFGTIIIYNVGILFTIQGKMNTLGFAELGYSFWLLLPSLLFHLTSISILYVRQYLISDIPKATRIGLYNIDSRNRML